MLNLVFRNFRSKINRENIIRFLGRENWFTGIYFFMANSFILEIEGNQPFFMGMGIAVILSMWLSFIVGNELPTAMYFCAVTDRERKQCFRKSLILQTTVLFLLNLGILLPVSCIDSSDTGGGIVAVLFVFICILPSVLRTGVDFEDKREKKLLNGDNWSVALTVLGYCVVFFMGNSLEYDTFHTATVVHRLVHTLWAKVVIIVMLLAIACYFYHYYPKIEAYMLDYERVQAVREQKEMKYQKKRRK